MTPVGNPTKPVIHMTKAEFETWRDQIKAELDAIEPQLPKEDDIELARNDVKESRDHLDRLKESAERLTKSGLPIPAPLQERIDEHQEEYGVRSDWLRKVEKNNESRRTLMEQKQTNQLAHIAEYYPGWIESGWVALKETRTRIGHVLKTHLDFPMFEPDFHFQKVQQALDKGFKIPEEVMRDYYASVETSALSRPVAPNFSLKFFQVNGDFAGVNLNTIPDDDLPNVLEDLNTLRQHGYHIQHIAAGRLIVERRVYADFSIQPLQNQYTPYGQSHAE